MTTQLLPGGPPPTPGVGPGLLGGGSLPSGPGPVGSFVDNGIAGAAVDSGVAIRGPIYKLIRRDFGPEELYNLALDPGEQVDLLNLPWLPGPAADAYAELSATLDGLLASED